MTWKTTNTAKGDNKLYSDAKGVVPSLDLRFASQKNLNDYMTGQNLITFSRPVGTNQSPGTYVDENGIIQLSSADTPRFDHNPTTGESLGLLIEESRTNLFPYSQEFSLANWGFTGAVPSLNVLNAPDGTLTADKITENLTTGTHQTFKTVAVSNTPHSFSVFAKASGRTQIRMVLFDGASSRTAFFDLLTGATSGELFATALTEELPNGWWRCVLTFTPVATSSALALIRLVDENGSDQYTGDNTSGVLLWGAQLETGAFPTSYIPTTGTALTRSADMATISGSNFSSWYNQSEGSVYFKGGPRLAIPAPNNSYLLTFAGFSANSDQMVLYQNFFFQSVVSTRKLGVFGPSAAISPAGAGVSDNAFGYSLNSVSYSRNTDFQTGTNANPISTAIIKLDLGLLNSASYLNGHISRLTYWPERLPDATLQAITAS